MTKHPQVHWASCFTSNSHSFNSLQSLANKKTPEFSLEGFKDSSSLTQKLLLFGSFFLSGFFLTCLFSSFFLCHLLLLFVACCFACCLPCCCFRCRTYQVAFHSSHFTVRILLSHSTTFYISQRAQFTFCSLTCSDSKCS